MTRPRSAAGERAPLLAPASPVKPPPPSTVSSSSAASRVADKPRFPFQPHAHDTPLWRKLLLHFFDNHRHPEELGDDDVWPLDPQFKAHQAADEVVRCMPTRGRWRLLRGLWRVNRNRLLWMSVWNAITMALCVVRPLLLWHLCYVDLSDVDTSTEKRLFGRDMRLVVPVTGTFAARVLMSLTAAQCDLLASYVSIHVTQSLSKMMMSKMATFGQLAAAEASTGTASTGHKERLLQISSLLSTDIGLLSYLLAHIGDLWVAMVRLGITVAALFSIMKISWELIGFIALAYAVALAVLAVIRYLITYNVKDLQVVLLKLLYDSLSGIQFTKLSTWEDKAVAKIEQARFEERDAWTRLWMCRDILQHIMHEIPLVVAVLAFASSVEPNAAFSTSPPSLTALRVFAALVLVGDCCSCVVEVIPSISMVLAGIRALERTEAYVLSTVGDNTSMSSSSAPREGPSKPYLSKMAGVCVSPASRPTCAAAQVLDVNWTLHQGDLVVIHGPAGVGKSILLAALRADQSSARVMMGSFEGLPSGCRVAYCSQDPWLQTLSIRENILFGTAFDKAKYWAVVDACGLLEDLSMLPNGDATIVGPRGINLSSGQSARIALARACYADADVYLLDCPLANVDAVVQSEIFRKCIVELLMLKTVVIVTHNPEYIGSSYVDQLVEVKSCGVRVTCRLSTNGKATTCVNKPRETRRTRDYDVRSTRSGSTTTLRVGELPREAREAAMRIELLWNECFKDQSAQLLCATVISKETAKEYFLGGGVTSMVWLGLAVLLSAALVITSVVKDMWVIYWVTINLDGYSSTDTVDGTIWYAFLAIASILLAVMCTWCVFAFNAASIDALFRRTTHALVRATMSFYYETRVGEILNRYQEDVNILDKSLPRHMKIFLVCIFAFIGRIVVFWWILGSIAVSVTILGYGLVLYCNSVHFYNQLGRTLVRAQARQMSFLSEVLDGEAVIRAFGSDCVQHLVDELERINERVRRAEYMSNVFNWHTIIKLSAAIALLSLSLLGVLAVYPVSSLELTIVLFYVFTIEEDLLPEFSTGFINGVGGLDSVEKLRRLCDVPAEDEGMPSMLTISSTDLWPPCGQVSFENVNFAYAHDGSRVDIPSALNDVSFSLRGGEKVGIVGRTGSGKSSLAMALLRVHPLRSGRILIDGVDLRSVSLAQLRRSITIIPQSPMFYRCSIRDYLDPFHEFDDAQLWRELLRVDLGGRVQRLDEELLDNGENWSLGQRQLLCFARALLKPSRVVVLDEAFSCVDQSHQEKILRILRERLASSTVVLITHRVDQILAFDRILVMRGGRLVESGSAVELASDPGSLFYEFLETSLLTQ